MQTNQKANLTRNTDVRYRFSGIFGCSGLMAGRGAVYMIVLSRWIVVRHCYKGSKKKHSRMAVLEVEQQGNPVE